MAELVHSIREVGLLQPVVVRPRRRRAATSWSWASAAGGPPRRPGSTTIPAIVRETDDDDMLRDALLENLHRSQLNPLEEAAAYQQLLEDFGCTHEELAARIGRSPPADQQHAAAAQALARPCSAGSPPACSPPATPGRCWRSRTPRSRTGSRQRVVAEGICVRGLEEIVAVGDHGSGAPARRAPQPARPRPASTTSPTGSPTGSRPGSRSTSASARARSPSSSPRWTTSSGSST